MCCDDEIPWVASFGDETQTDDGWFENWVDKSPWVLSFGTETQGNENWLVWCDDESPLVLQNWSSETPRDES